MNNVKYYRGTEVQIVRCTKAGLAAILGHGMRIGQRGNTLPTVAQADRRMIKAFWSRTSSAGSEG